MTAARAAAPQLVVRPAVEADAPTVAVIHRAAVLAAYRPLLSPGLPEPTLEDLRAGAETLLHDPCATVLVGQWAGASVATAAARADPGGDGSGELRRLHVLPAVWGRGVGGGMYDAALDWLCAAGVRVAGLWVLEANARARRMYEARGWRLCPGRTLRWSDADVLEVRYERRLP